MAQGNVFGLCVGVSRYTDGGLAPLPDAAATAREVQKALDPKLFSGVSTISDPGTNGDLFLRLQKAARDAKGGAFFLYYAGHALRRGNDLLLAARDSELEGTKGCVPWSDVRDMLKREAVAAGVVILNVDIAGGAPRLQIGSDTVAVIGSVRTYDAAAGNANLRAYADALVRLLQGPTAEVSPYLVDHVLDANGLHKALEKKATTTAPHASFAPGSRPLVLRDLTPAPASVRAPAPAPAPPPKPAELEPPAPAPEPPPTAPQVVAAPAPAPASEAPPPPPPAPAPALTPALTPTPTPAPTPMLAPVPLPTAAIVPSRQSSRLAYGLIAIAALVAAIVYALLRH